MIKKQCNHCGVRCWHNPCQVKDREPRCTFCGHPPGGNSGSMKREYAENVRNRQVARARLLCIVEV